MLRGDLHDPADLTMAFDRVTEQTLTPWYRDQIDRDYQRAAQIKAAIDGRHPGHLGDDPRRPAQAAFLRPPAPIRTSRGPSWT